MSSSLCDYGDVVVDGRKLTEVQANRLFVVIGRVFLMGLNLSHKTYRAVTARITAEESPSIDIISITENGGSITICRNDSETPMYHTDRDDYNIVDIFLPPAEYDALIGHINAV